MSRPPWSVIVTVRADRDLDRLDQRMRQRFVAAIDRLAADDSRADVRKLSGTDELRLRVGE